MFANNNQKFLCPRGKDFLNSTLEESLIDWLPYRSNTFLDKLLSFISSEKKQSFLKNIVYEEMIVLQIRFKHELNDIINILNNGNIYELREQIQSSKELPLYMSYCLDYLIDEYNIDIFEGEEKIEIKDISTALVFIYMREVLFYMVQGNTDVKKKNNVITIKPNLESEKWLKERWMAISWDKQSFSYFSMNNHKLFMKHRVKEVNGYINAMSDLFMDRIFYLHPKYIDKKHFELQAMNYMKNLCKFFAYLLYGFYSGTKISYKGNKRFSKLGLEPEFITQIIEENKNKVNLNKGFEIKGNNLSYIDGSAHDFILRSYFNDYVASNIKSNFAEAGDIFEENIYNYIKHQSTLFKEYEIFWIDTKGKYTEKIKGKKVKLDVDLILHDKVREKYFLIQAKHAFFAKPYLKDEVHHFCNSNDSIQKGIKQLKTFNYFYNKNEKLKGQFKELGLVNLNENNTYLLLVHSMPIYDFRQIGNVVMYDWNTLRNLLQYGLRWSSYQNLDGGDFSIQSKELLEIEKPNETREYLLNTTEIDSDSNMTMQDAYMLFKHTYNYVGTERYKIETSIK